MSKSLVVPAPLPAIVFLPRPVRRALLRLLTLHDYALDVGDDVWEFAAPLDTLLRFGVEELDLRWLTRKGYVSIADRPEVARLGEGTQQSVPVATHLCATLTAAGVRITRELRVNRGRVAVPLPPPVWSPETRELYIHGHIERSYRQPAPNQEAILNAYQEENWPPHILDPLSPLEVDRSTPQVRLGDTVRFLNAKLKRLYFERDGRGEGVIWKWDPKYIAG